MSIKCKFHGHGDGTYHFTKDEYIKHLEMVLRSKLRLIPTLLTDFITKIDELRAEYLNEVDENE